MSAPAAPRQDEDHLNRLGLEDELFLQSILAGNSTHQLQHFFQHQHQHQQLSGFPLHLQHNGLTTQSHSPSISDILPQSLSGFVSSASPAALHCPTLQIDALDPTLKRGRYSPSATGPPPGPAMSVQSSLQHRPANFQRLRHHLAPQAAAVESQPTALLTARENTGGSQPEETEGMDEAASARSRDSVLQRNRLAQRKFRVRQKVGACVACWPESSPVDWLVSNVFKYNFKSEKAMMPGWHANAADPML